MSKGEQIIKQILDDCNIQYVREYPLLIQEERNGKPYLRIWYPDFWLSQLGIVIEYFGMNDKKYLKDSEHKKETYKKLHIDLIPVYPKTLDKDIKSYLLKTMMRIINSKAKIFHDNLSNCNKVQCVRK